MIIISNGSKSKKQSSNLTKTGMDDMCGYSPKARFFLDWKGNWNELSCLIFMLLIILLISGCNPTLSKQVYENSKAGIRVVKPANWDLAYSERNGIVTLVTETGVWEKESVRIEIHGPACLSIATNYNSPYEELEANIDRIRILYDLELVTIVQEPIEVKSGNYEYIRAVILIPTIALRNDPNRNQVGDSDQNISQPVDVYAISDGNDTLMAYIYRGNSQPLNIQAQEIVESIQLTCSP